MTRDIMREYLEEPIDFGGEVMARGAAIKAMEADGLDPRAISAWMMGYDMSFGSVLTRAPSRSGRCETAECACRGILDSHNADRRSGGGK